MENNENLNTVTGKYKEQGKKIKKLSSVYNLVDLDRYIVAPGSTNMLHVLQKCKLDDDYEEVNTIPATSQWDDVA